MNGENKLTLELGESILQEVLNQLELPENANLSPKDKSMRAYRLLTQILMDKNLYESHIGPLTARLKEMGIMESESGKEIIPSTEASRRKSDLEESSMSKPSDQREYYKKRPSKIDYFTKRDAWKNARRVESTDPDYERLEPDNK